MSMFGEREGVGPGDLDLALDRHVPQRDVLEQMPVFLLDVREADREQHVVVDGVGLRAVALRGFEEGAPAQPRAALDEVHVECHRNRDQ